MALLIEPRKLLRAVPSLGECRAVCESRTEQGWNQGLIPAVFIPPLRSFGISTGVSLRNVYLVPDKGSGALINRQRAGFEEYERE